MCPDECLLHEHIHESMGDQMAEIRLAEKNTPLWQDTVAFIEACSWAEAKDHLADMLKNWAFTDWETMIAACREDKVVGIATVMKTDYYPLPDLCPWVSSIFVTEEARGNRISGKMIGFANRYLKQHGFDRSYIPSEFTGLYEKYGYTYVKKIVNYGGRVDHLFVKEF